MKKLDLINLTAVVLAVVGVILEVVGGVVFSGPTTVGMKLDLSPRLYVGIAVMIAGLAAAIVGTAMTEKKQLNKTVSSVALYAAVIALLFALVFLVLTIVMPVLNPTNG